MLATAGKKLSAVFGEDTRKSKGNICVKLFVRGVSRINAQISWRKLLNYQTCFEYCSAVRHKGWKGVECKKLPKDAKKQGLRKQKKIRVAFKLVSGVQNVFYFLNLIFMYKRPKTAAKCILKFYFSVQLWKCLLSPKSPEKSFVKSSLKFATQKKWHEPSTPCKRVFAIF